MTSPNEKEEIVERFELLPDYYSLTWISMQYYYCTEKDEAGNLKYKQPN